MVYQKLSGSRSAYWYLRPIWFICGATGERRVDEICERMIDADRSRFGSQPCLLQWRHSTITYASWGVWTISGIGSVIHEHPAMMRGVGTYGSFPISIAVECPSDTRKRSEKNLLNEEIIWEQTRSLNLERKLGNLTKERGMSRWVVISIRSLFLSLQILEVYENEFRAALRGITKTA